MNNKKYGIYEFTEKRWITYYILPMLDETEVKEKGYVKIGESNNKKNAIKWVKGGMKGSL